MAPNPSYFDAAMEGLTSDASGYHTDGGIDRGRSRAEQNGGISGAALPPQEEAEPRVRSSKRSDDAEEIARLKALVRSLRGQLAAAAGDAPDFGADIEKENIEAPLKSGEDVPGPRRARHCRRLRRLCGCGGDFSRHYDETSVSQLVASRSGWLCLFLLSLFLTSVVINHFEEYLEADLELANYLPLLIGHGGNAGGQSVSTVLAALAARRVRPRDSWRVTAKEGLAGLGAGVVTAAVSVPFLRLMSNDLHVQATVPVAILIVTAAASVVAAGLPFLVLNCSLNPNVIAAPAMTTIVDVGGIVIYFYVAKAVLVIFGLEWS